MTISRLTSIASVVISGWLLAACHTQSNSSNVKDSATFDRVPPTTDQDSIESQLKRYKGQTKFLNPMSNYGPYNIDRSAAEAGGDARAIQESDIFKVGKSGSKLLYLLNNYRGLQVVSFEDGVDQPKIVGRVDATGHWSDSMYYDEAHDRLIVLERHWETSTENQTQAVVYDVSVATQPKIIQTLELPGMLADSRIVGNVLYVASTVQTQNWNSSVENSGRIVSVDLSQQESLSTIATHTLTLPVSYRENLNIVEVQEQDSYKYYLIAVLSNSSWGFWDRSSQVEVIDISSTAGVIAPVMTVSAKGTINERSQTHIKDSTLIVTSNYGTGENPWQNQRIAVETFVFPSSTSETISEDEATFRRLNIQRELDKKRADMTAAGESEDAIIAAIDALRETLASDATTGLKNRFVSTANGLKKLLADSIITVGSTQGLSASLQDVRYEGNNLYVYWVPSNNIDPLDLFDLSDVRNGVTYRGRLEFDGWIQRAIPVTYSGRQFIVGLGWVIPAVNNEENRRYPQTMLFEITGSGTSTTARQISNLTLANSNVWANLNDQDKTIELKVDDTGQGTIMFPIYLWSSNSYVSGGKLIGLNLQAAIDSTLGQVFQEGGVLAASESWLRRVFTNPEIERINTFSDTSLGTFEVPTGVGSANNVFRAMSTLELARRIVSYTVLSQDSSKVGVQIISDYDYYWTNEAVQTELRVVQTSQADAELQDVINKSSLDGAYKTHLQISDNSLLVVTKSYEQSTVDNVETTTSKLQLWLVKLSADSRGIEIASTGTVVETNTNDSNGLTSRIWFPYYSSEISLAKLASGEIILNNNTELYSIGLADTDLEITKIEAQTCSVTDTTLANIKILSGKAYLWAQQTVQDPTRTDVSYTRNLVAPLMISETGGVCGSYINIPGEPAAMLEADILVTKDERLKAITQHTNDTYTWYNIRTETNAASVKLGQTLASLTDLYSAADGQLASLQLLNDQTIVLLNSENEQSSWLQNYEHDLIFLNVDSDGDFVQDRATLNLDFANGQIVKLMPSQDGQTVRALVFGNTKVSLLNIDLSSFETSVEKLARVAADGTASAEAQSVTLPGSWVLYDSHAKSRVHYDETAASIMIAQDLYGITQLNILR